MFSSSVAPGMDTENGEDVESSNLQFDKIFNIMLRFKIGIYTEYLFKCANEKWLSLKAKD